MKVGGEYRLQNTGKRHWEKFAKELGGSQPKLIDRLTQMAERLPDEANMTSQIIKESGLDNPIVDHLAKTITDRAIACMKMLKA